MDLRDDSVIDRKLLREANRFVARLRSGEATTEDAAALKQWRAQSPAHETAFHEAAGLWRDLGPALTGKRRMVTRTMVSRRTFLTGSALAASSAGVLFASSTLGLLPTLDAIAADHATGIGEQKTVTLADGSVVELDAQSTLNVSYTDERRELSLIRGAAVFTVAKDTRPFVVLAANGSTMATGTVFCVEHAADHVGVTCVEGSVEVSRLGQKALSAGERVDYSNAGLSEKGETPEDLVATWRRGLLVFQDRPLADVLSDVNRHRSGRVILARGSLGDRRVSGVFHLDRTDEILAHVEKSLGVRATALIGGIVVLR